MYFQQPTFGPGTQQAYGIAGLNIYYKWYFGARKWGVVDRYYGGAGRHRRGRCGDLVGHLGQVRKRIENVGGVLRGSTCYASVLVRMSTVGTTLGSFGGRLLTGRVRAYIIRSVGGNGTSAISRLYSALRGLVG